MFQRLCIVSFIACLSGMAMSGHALASSLSNVGGFGGNLTKGFDLSADGSVTVGYARYGSGFEHAFYRTDSNGLQDIGALGGNWSYAYGVSNDGNVVVGFAEKANSSYEAFRWTQSNGMVGLGILPGGTNSYAYETNADGSVITGYAYNSSGSGEAFRWTQATGMVGLGTGTYTASYGYDLSSDGNIIVGFLYNANTNYSEAFRWTQGTGLVGLGYIPGGNDSYAYAISGDGSTIVGEGNTASGYYHAYRWTQSTGFVDLGTLGGIYSYSFNTNANGTIVVGSSEDGNGILRAFRWSQADGMKSLEDILTGQGVSLSGWSVLSVANAVTADGKTIIGNGTYGGEQRAFLMTDTALTTPEDLVSSLSPLDVAAQQSQSFVVQGVTQSMVVARNAMSVYFAPHQNPGNAASQDYDSFAYMAPASIEPGASKPSFRDPQKRKAVYATGSFGAGQNNNFTNNAINGATGVLVEISDGLAIGGGLTGNQSHQKTYLQGSVDTNSLGGSLLAAYEPPSRLRLYGTLGISQLDFRSKRHYINGGSVDGSRGDTNGLGYGVGARAGYEFELNSETAFTPYTELQWSRTHLDAYTETGGGIPAAVANQRNDLTTSHIGAELSRNLIHGINVRGRVAWGHRVSGDDNSVSVQVLGFNQTVTGNLGDRDWAEAGVTASYRVNDKLSLTGDIGGRAGKTADPAINATVGVVWFWN